MLAGPTRPPGGDQTATADSPTAEHAWSEPGHYRVFVEATGDGPPATDEMPVTVVWPLAEPAPLHASPLVAARGLYYAVLPDEGQVVRVDPDTGEVQRQPTCSRPRTVAVSGEAFAVACDGDDTLVLGAWDDHLAYPLPYGSRPRSTSA